ncbi:uncharacterized protein LOC136087573 [Hydra vulgaris]|uniref:Uncharacterized protein LOC136087573 n=1 Tax=Hydra vulgaris TaxID=6087 RepID=A0ABM4CXX7_HYDVU
MFSSEEKHYNLDLLMDMLSSMFSSEEKRFPSKKIKNHQKNREKVCLFCGCICHMKINSQSHTISKFQSCFSDYKIADDERYPTGLCPRCRGIAERTNVVDLRQKINFDIDWPKMTIPAKTRNGKLKTCSCEICKIARTQGRIPKKKYGIKSFKTAAIILRCSFCLTKVKRGLHHKCNATTLR